MSDEMSHQEAEWHRSLAIQNNNSAWDLVERPTLDDVEMMQLVTAASVAQFHWYAVGTPSNKAHADMLFSLAMSKTGCGEIALVAGTSALRYFDENSSQDWERAFANAAMAYAFHCKRDVEQYCRFYATAKELGSRLNPSERTAFDATFRLIPSE